MLRCFKYQLYFCSVVDANPTGQKTYILSDEKMTWADAQDYCRTHHTDLAMIESPEENAAMASVQGLNVAWIGLYRVAWMWSDKSNSSFTNWKSGEPDNFFGQFCVAENLQNDWLDQSCNNKNPFFCQQGKRNFNSHTHLRFYERC